jgi:NADH-quinone oxidoreductase subunit L
MPITYATFLIGSLALCAIPPFAGFFSKDTIIEAAKLSTTKGSAYAYFCVSVGAMVTALYTFRALFMTFHGKPRMDAHTFSHVKESPWVVWLPLVLLAIPSAIVGYILYMPMLFKQPTLLGQSIFVLPSHHVLLKMAHEISSPMHAILHAFVSWIFWATLGSVAVAWVCYIRFPAIPGILARTLSWPYRLLMNKYGFDAFNEIFFVKGSKALGEGFYQMGDQRVIDGFFVNGTGRTLKRLALSMSTFQNGYLYHYIAVMVFGLFGFLCWLILR